MGRLEVRLSMPGVIPQDAQLTPWPDNLLKKWDSLSPDEKKLFIRQGDVFAASLMYTGYEIGRVINEDDHVPFEFIGTIDKLTIALDRSKLTPEDIQKLKQAEMWAADTR
jgi:hypothetical protein